MTWRSLDDYTGICGGYADFLLACYGVHGIRGEYIEVDAHNIVPCWEAAPKQAYAARSLRLPINVKLSRFLVPFSLPQPPAYPWKGSFPTVNWQEAYSAIKIPEKVPPVLWLTPGEAAAHKMLDAFIDKGLKGYAAHRNDPTQDRKENPHARPSAP